jgi:hypothetical protein
MENKIPTAKEFLWNGTIITQGDTEPYGRLPNDKVPLVMIEFAKLHVEEALKEASEDANMDSDYYQALQVYPLTNIK